MRKIGIIGLGHVGATIAYTLVVKGIVDQMVLIDSNNDKAVAEQYDLLDSMAGLETSPTIIIQDYAALRDADIVVTAFGNVDAENGGGQLDELAFNQRAAKQVATQIKQTGFRGVLINLSNPCDVITMALQQLTNLPTKQVLGTGTLLDTAQIKRTLGMKLGVDSKNIGGYVYGEQGGSQFVAWSTITVNGRPIGEIQADYGLDYESLVVDAKQGGWYVLAGKGYTAYAITTWVVKLILAVLTNAQLAVPVSAYHPGLQTYIGQPALVGTDGIGSLAFLKLTELEQGQLESAASFIKQKFASLV